MSLALYRKYRPKSFSEIIGQKCAVDILENAARQNKFSHAYLFYGPRGTGKTTIARLIAKAANCLVGKSCNKCKICQAINNGKAMDVIEIDAASNRGIDEVRQLKEAVKATPSVCRRKVFIIDEVHMLTKEAFNALLKILEEPPEHVILILATTEYEKLPATIVSRAQRFHLTRLPIASILKKIKMIAEREKIKATDEALELIAAIADGSARDAESLLDQMASMATKITAENVEKIIGRTGFRSIALLVDLLLEANVGDCLRYLAQARAAGHNMVDLNKELIVYLRRALALKCDSALENIFKKELTTENLVRLKQQAERIDIRQTVSLIKSLIQAYSEARYSPIPHIPLEIAIIENLVKNI